MYGTDPPPLLLLSFVISEEFLCVGTVGGVSSPLCACVAVRVGTRLIVRTGVRNSGEKASCGSERKPAWRVGKEKERKVKSGVSGFGETGVP